MFGFLGKLAKGALGIVASVNPVTKFAYDQIIKGTSHPPAPAPNVPVEVQYNPQPMRSWPPDLPMNYMGSSGGSPVNTYQPPGSSAVPRKRIAAPRRAGKLRRSTGKVTKKRKLKFGSPAWRKKYMPKKRRSA